jgi:hypothetical protein
MKNALEKTLDSLKFTGKHDWIIPAAEAFGRENGTGGVRQTVMFLIQSALEHYGYCGSEYKPGLVEKPLLKKEESKEESKVIFFNPLWSGHQLMPKNCCKIISFKYSYLEY